MGEVHQHPEVQKRLDPEYWYRRANVPVRHCSEDFGQYDEDLGNKQVLERVIDFTQELVNEELPPGRGLALFGPPGRGKTLLACTVLCTYIHESFPTGLDNILKFVPPGYYITLAGYVGLYHESLELDRWISRSPASWDEVASRWMDNFEDRRRIREDVELLVLDDVGKEHTAKSGYSEDLFHSLFRGRYDDGLRTIITSNLSAEQFEIAYGAAQFSFVYEACEVIEVPGGVDVRRKAKA